MIRVAGGERLQFAQKDVARRGWAIECRINAEDPVRGFLPSTGRLVVFRPPATTLVAGDPQAAGTPGVRVDTGVYEGGEIPVHYDSMICKLIACGDDRSDAIARMREALNGFVVRGVASNLAFQAALLGHPRFAAGDFTTAFIAEEFAHGFDPAAVAHDERDFLVALAVACERRLLARAAGLGGQLPGHEVQIGERFVAVELQGDGSARETPAEVRVEGGEFVVAIAGKSRRIALATPLASIALEGTVDGKPFRAQVERVGLTLRVAHDGARAEVRVLTPRAAELRALMPWKPPPDLSRFLLSPMPGLLVQVAVKPGQAVRAGERLAVIEAMKMENVVVAAHDGVVERIVATPGESVAVDEVILEFADAGAKR
jgi:propionyl-CoA carboxylase alpha chain